MFMASPEVILIQLVSSPELVPNRELVVNPELVSNPEVEVT